MGVGNVGFFSKTFFGEERYNGPGVAKHRTSLGESTDVMHRKYGCLHQRSPMFLFSDKVESMGYGFVDLVEENGFDVLPLNHLPQHMG